MEDRFRQSIRLAEKVAMWELELASTQDNTGAGAIKRGVEGRLEAARKELAADPLAQAYLDQARLVMKAQRLREDMLRDSPLGVFLSSLSSLLGEELDLTVGPHATEDAIWQKLLPAELAAESFEEAWSAFQAAFKSSDRFNTVRHLIALADHIRAHFKEADFPPLVGYRFPTIPNKTKQ